VCYQYDEKGNIIKEYSSVASCCRETKFTPSKVQSACRNNTYYKNYFWSYIRDYKFESLENNSRLLAYLKSRGREVYIKETGERFISILSLSKKYNITLSKIKWAMKNNKSVDNLTIFYGR